MAAESRLQREIKDLKSDNRRLAKENERLSKLISASDSTSRDRKRPNVFHKLAVASFVALSVLLLFAGNILFWTGNTIVKTDRYAEAVQPLIREPEIQNAISSYATQQFYKTVDVESLTEQALPPRAAFLAPTLSDKLRENTRSVVGKLIASPKFEDSWNKVNENAHARFIDSIKRNGSDGTLDLNEFYQQISQELKSTKLAFLADKSLPPKVGSIALVQGDWISKLQTVINNIDLWRTIALLLLLAFSSLAVWLSRNRRRTVIKIGLFFAAGMLLTLLLIRIAREVISGKVDAQYAPAADQAVQTVLHPLAVQSATILAFGLLIAFIAWITGPSRAAGAVTSKIQLLFGGKLHGAIFSNENRFTAFIGKYKRTLQWVVLAVILSLLLLIRLTPEVLIYSALSALVMTLVIELLAAE